ncbi:hypothetical protein FVEG_13133 [Fusarium verticillioides 7600]|uniref:Uncharacterized protein n=1 Tax=Gibberella moniliformis (strain M3125 / FGSC 7600) TaxID=334819 RepID=W7MU96_GIBM7|nr:hypothetical protein FVEG_13133 [Fusarium verticillioides 7600]EWG55083.1 hypothetical protein FVEG_13133 [Fusarium verticillioides 7600]
MLTCRTIADETRDLPLSLNAVTFSTIYREDWRSLAGCFNVVTTYYRHLQADLVLHLAEVMTTEMYGQFALKYPEVASQLEALSRDHRLRYFDENSTNLSQVMAIESASGAKRARIEHWRGRHCCVVVQDILAHVNAALKWSDIGYSSFASIHRDRNNRGHPSNTWFGVESEVQDALSYCLRLIADKRPAQFATHLRAIFPRWTGPDIVQDFLNLRFDNWAIPSEREVKNAIRLLDIAGIWEFPDKWHYPRPPPAVDGLGEYPGDEFDSDYVSDDDQQDDQDDEDDEDDEDDKDDEGDEGDKGDMQVPSGLHCREKIRFSAAASAIRFLKRIPGQRIRLKHLVLHKDFNSVNDPHTHARGLAAFVKENPSLKILRRVSMLDCIIGVSHSPNFLVELLQRGERITVAPLFSLSRDISYWIKDALVVEDVGFPVNSLTLHLEAGSHQDFCTDLLQRIVHRDVAWCRSYNLRLARGTFIHDERSSSDILMMIMHGEDLEAIDELVNQTSGVLSADFNTGVALDAQALARQTKHIHGSNWISRWRLRLRDGSLSLAEEMPPEQNYDRLDDIFEFQTDKGNAVINLQSCNQDT